MKHPMEQQYKRFRNFVFGLCVLAAALLLLTTVKNIVNSLAAERWEIHQGVVINGSEGMGGILSSAYGSSSGWPEYQYEIDGHKYRNKTIGFGINKPASVLKAGDPIKVYVNPDDKAESVLAVGLVKGHIIGLLFSVGFILLGAHLWRRV
ncbi:MAG TPA: DUF3592 domain-containing protein [Cellvibrio sp.]|nr:DUF3592 domain-containing protein [Cellvibrio sp.]